MGSCLLNFEKDKKVP